MLGTTDGEALYLGVCLIKRAVTLHCTRPRCAGRLQWHPSDASVSRRQDNKPARW